MNKAITFRWCCYALLIMVPAIACMRISLGEPNYGVRTADDLLGKIYLNLKSEKRQEREEAYKDYHAASVQILGNIKWSIDDNFGGSTETDQTVHNKADKDLVSSTRCLALYLTKPTLPLKALPYILKNLEYEAVPGVPLMEQDGKYRNHPAVYALKNYGSSATIEVLHFLTRTPEAHLSDKSIEILGDYFQSCYGSGQSSIRIITVLAEEATKRPRNPNVVRLINHIGNTYKP